MPTDLPNAMPSSESTRAFSGQEQAAILLMSLGEDAAAEVFKHLNAREVQQLSSTMAALPQIMRADVLDVLESFRLDCEQSMAVSLGSDDYIRSVLVKALGSERAAGLIEEIFDAGEATNGIEALNWMEARTVAEIIGNEHPQIIATILVHLESSRAAAVLALLTERLREDVMLRIATFGGVQPTALSELTEVLEAVVTGQGARRSKMGGIRSAAEILNALPSATEESVIESLRARDAELAQRIVDEMFTFDSLINVEDQGIQLLLKEIDTDTLLIALKGVADELRDKFLRNMSSRAAGMLREDLQAQGPVRASRVEAEQKNIVQIARRLAESGQIVLNAQGDDAYV